MAHGFRMLALVLFVLTFASVALAQDVEVEHLAVHESIILGEQAAFDVRITNSQDYLDTFRFSTNDLSWDLLSDPLYHYFSGVDIRSGDSETVRLLLAPDDSLKIGQYRVDVKVKSQKGKFNTTMPLFVTIRPSKPLIQEYLAAVTKIVEIDSVVDPTKEFTVKVNLINRNPKDLKTVKVDFSSSLFSRETITSLGSLERKTVEETFQLDPLTPPQEASVTVKLIVDGSVLEPTITENFEIGAYSEISEQSVEVERSFLRTATTTTYKNNGNVLGTEVIEVPMGAFRNFFTKTAPSASQVKRDGNKYLSWELSLAPQKSISITTTTSYRSLLVIFLIIAASVGLYYFLRSPAYIVKRANVQTIKDSGISELKIVVHVKNRTNKAFERATITDTIPTLADVSAGHDIGTLKPDSVYNDGTKTIVKWDMKRIEPGEDRILSYTMKAKLAFLGSVTLPPAVMRFYSKTGAKLINKSSAIKVRV